MKIWLTWNVVQPPKREEGFEQRIFSFGKLRLTFKWPKVEAPQA